VSEKKREEKADGQRVRRSGTCSRAMMLCTCSLLLPLPLDFEFWREALGGSDDVAFNRAAATFFLASTCDVRRVTCDVWRVTCDVRRVTSDV
jgi:hypothetical protein